MASENSTQAEGSPQPPPADRPAAEPPRAEPPADYTIIGWPGSGKTALLATVLRKTASSYTDAPGRPSVEHDPPQVGAAGRDTRRADVGALLRQGGQLIFNGGTVQATEQTTHVYRFDVKIGRRDILRGPATHRFSMVDGGGELLMPPEDQELDPANSHLAALKEAKGVILCIPVYPPPAESSYLDWLQSMLMWLGRPPSRLKRLAVCLTKYEQVTADYGPDAFTQAENVDVFIEVVHHVLSRDILEPLRNLSATVEIAVTPVSVYGFVGGNGCANFDPYHPPAFGGMLLQATHPRRLGGNGIRSWPLYEIDEVRRRWIPYRIIDPFVYLVTGQGGSLTLPLNDVLQQIDDGTADDDFP